MGGAKEIIVKKINSKLGGDFIRKYHYSGKNVQNAALYFGAFLNDRLHGVMSFGTPMDKRKVLGLVEGTLWNEMLELNRMAFDPALPRNSESRCIAIAIKLIKKNAPHIKWILSFADGTLCGDGTIYRASGFLLTQINTNKTLMRMPDGELIADLTIQAHGANGFSNKKDSQLNQLVKKYNLKFTGAPSVKPLLDAGGVYIKGFQLRYIKLLHEGLKLNCPVLPFSKIDETGAGMYKGKNISVESRKPAGEVHVVEQLASSQKEGGSNPTHLLK